MLLWLSASICSHASLTTTPFNNQVAKGLAPTPQHTIKSLQRYHGDFRILGAKTYHDDLEAQFSPVDFAVSRGLFAQPRFARQIRINQSNRFLTWSIPSLPIPAQQAMKLVSNMHIIPASPQIALQLQQVKRGDLVRLEGDLVEIDSGNLQWRSSLRSDDVGDGACEVFRVARIQWLSSL